MGEVDICLCVALCIEESVLTFKLDHLFSADILEATVHYYTESIRVHQ